jgi:hypothetical protein
MDLTKEIDIAVMEAALDMIEARSRYRSKMALIEDVKNDVWITESEYEEYSSLGSEVVMETSITTPKGKFEYDKTEFEAYRYDFITHDSSIGAENRKLATLAIGAYQASHEARKETGYAKSMPLINLLGDRSEKINEIAKKRYNGKTEAYYDLVQAVKADTNHRYFISLNVITGYDTTTSPGTNNIPGNLVSVSFKLKLPKYPLNAFGFVACKEYDKLLAKRKEIKNSSYTKDPGELRKEEKKLEENIESLMQGYCHFTSYPNDKMNIAKLYVGSCYADTTEIKEYIIAEHLKRSKSSTLECNKKVDSIDSMKNSRMEIKIPNNRDPIARMAMVFGFSTK